MNSGKNEALQKFLFFILRAPRGCPAVEARIEQTSSDKVKIAYLSFGGIFKRAKAVFKRSNLTLRL
jgi:hypothetical protein